MKEYPAELELLDLLNVICKLGMGFSQDKAVIDLSIRRWYVFDNNNPKQALMIPENAFSTKTSLASMLLRNKKAAH